MAKKQKNTPAKRGNGTRAPFQKGNAVPVSHGARSPKVYGAVAQQLTAGLLQTRPDLEAYPEAVTAWATAEARSLLYRKHLDEVGELDEEGQPRDGLLRWAHAAENSAAKHRATLGLDPRSEASLARERAAARSVAVDLEAILSAGQQALDARSGDAAALDSTGDGDEGQDGDVAAKVLEKIRADGAAIQRQARDEWEGYR